MDSYWRWCVRSDEDRDFVGQVVERVRGGGTWTEGEYREWIRARVGKGKENGAEEGQNGAKEEKDAEEDEANGTGEKL